MWSCQQACRVRAGTAEPAVVHLTQTIDAFNVETGATTLMTATAIVSEDVAAGTSITSIITINMIFYYLQTSFMFLSFFFFLTDPVLDLVPVLDLGIAAIIHVLALEAAAITG